MSLRIRLTGLPCWSDGKESSCKAGDLGLILGSGRSPGEGNGNPLQYSRLENSMDRGAWWVIVHGVTKSLDRTEQLTLSLLVIYINKSCSGCSIIFKRVKLSWAKKFETAIDPSLFFFYKSIQGDLSGNSFLVPDPLCFLNPCDLWPINCLTRWTNIL